MAIKDSDFQKDKDSSKVINMDRLQRMKAMTEMLYKDEFKPLKKTFRQIRYRTLILIVSLLAITTLAATTLFNYNRFIDLRENVLSAHGHVEASIQNRANLFSNLVNITLNQAQVEQELLGYVAELRAEFKGMKKPFPENGGVENSLTSGGETGAAQIPKPKEIGQGSFDSAFGRLMAVVEQYPDMKSSQTYVKLMDQLYEIESSILKRRAEWNEASRIYNNAITAYPWYWLGKAAGFERFEYFEADEISRKNPYLTNHSFTKLLPAKGRGN